MLDRATAVLAGTYLVCPSCGADFQGNGTLYRYHTCVYREDALIKNVAGRRRFVYLDNEYVDTLECEAWRCRDCDALLDNLVGLDDVHE